jgi:nucleoid-associated protein YgaU
VLRANPGLNPNNLKPGLVINLPPAEEVKASAAAEKSAKASAELAGAKMVDEVKIDASRQYKVVSGDSLYKIGQKLYGSGLMGDKIYEMNRQVIGADPKRLKLGMVLELPQAPTAGTAAAKASGPQGTRSTSGSLEEAWNSRSSRVIGY